MKKLFFASIILLLIFLGVTVYRSSLDLYRPAGNYSLILSPFGSRNEDGVWQGEIGPFMNSLEKASDLGSSMPLCDQFYSGYLSGQPVLLAVSGVGKAKTTACLVNILGKYGNRIKEVFLSGTGGISPVLNAGVGDICINSVSADFDMQRYGADRAGTGFAAPSFWTTPESAPSYAIADADLATQLFQASKTLVPLVPPEEVNRINARYDLTGHLPQVFGPDRCTEISGDLFWHDIRSDIHARRMASDLLNSGSGLHTTPQDVVIITSMEAYPVAILINTWNTRYDTRIKFAYVRGASNFDRPFLDQGGTSLVSSQSSLENGISPASVEFASQMAAAPILKLFELRK